MHSYTSVMEAASRPVTSQTEVLLVLNEHEGHKNTGYQVTLATSVCTVTPCTCGSSVLNLLHVTLLAPTILW